MKQKYRTQKFGRLIDREQKISFSFDGKEYEGYKGDTLASALLANGVKLMGRSFKYHRPRGCMTEDSHEPNAIVELGEGEYQEPNTRATMIEIYEGLQAKSQNRFPSLKFDVQAINQLFSPFLTAGFYYKTFMWPAAFWEPVYEKIIRKAAGLGSVSKLADPDTYEHAHTHCDILIVGAGVSGISAALATAESDARVIIVEEQYNVGGMVSELSTIDSMNAAKWCEENIEKLKKQKNITFMNRTTLFGYYDHNMVAALERVRDHIGAEPAHTPRQRLWTIRAKEIILACGAHERPLVFGNNDKPGIMLASAVRKFIEKYGAVAGKKFVIATNNDDAYKTAEIIIEIGAEVVAVVDARKKQSQYVKKIMEKGVRVITNTLPLKAHGKLNVNALSVQSTDGTFVGKIKCDCVAMSGGFSPDVHLASQTGAMPIWNEKIQGFIPNKPIHNERSVGAGSGIFDAKQCIEQGYKIGKEVVEKIGGKNKNTKIPKVKENETYNIKPIWECPGNAKAFVDMQNDVTKLDIILASQEGYKSVEHAKRYTTMGMATDQGKIANVNGLAILAKAQNKKIEEIGTTRFRPPYSPVAIGAFAGHERGKEFVPTRKTAMHQCGVKLGAVFVEAGQWLRPQYYPKPNENIMDSIYRETKQIRKTAGICDVSTLGKIEIFGEDSGEFLNHLYVNGWKMLENGKARYGVMLREDGYVMDDGTTSRLGDHHYFMTTTTANAASVLAHMEYAAQVLFPELDVHFCSATEQWCGVAVAGPNARKILQKTFKNTLDVSDENLPFMGVKTFQWLGDTARIFRISFSGELAFEVNVPWHNGENMWNEIYENGQEYGIIPYGTEALSAMRIEKGHVAGPELDGRTTLNDLGLGKMMSGKKSCIGQKLAQREGMIDKNRETLVGLKLTDAKGRLRGGAHLFADKENVNSENDLGWVTSVCDSPQLGTWIGLAFVKGGLEKYQGQTLYAVNPLYGEAPKVEVCSPHFFDPKGERLHG